MDKGESRFTFKCLQCGETSYDGGKVLGTGRVGAMLQKNLDTPCTQCGGKLLLYREEFCSGDGGDSEKTFDTEYQLARQALQQPPRQNGS